MQIEAGLSLDNVYLALKNKCIQIYTNIAVDLNWQLTNPVIGM